MPAVFRDEVHTMMFLVRRPWLPAALALLLWPATSQATLVLLTSPDNTNTDNVNFSGNTGPSNTIFGEVGNSTDYAKFTSSQTMNDPSGGQARVEAVSGSNNTVPMTNITIQAVGPGTGGPQETYDNLVFDAEGGNLKNVGPATLTVVTNLNTYMFNGSSTTAFAVSGNGSNFYTLQATNGEHILSATIVINTAGGKTGFGDLRQVRMGEVNTIVIQTATPEPSSVVLIALGLGSLGLGRLGWRFRKGRRGNAQPADA
jgi:hypothetical protein